MEVGGNTLDSAGAHDEYFGSLPQNFNEHTHGHVRCPACASRARMLVDAEQDWSALAFSDVIPLWEQIRKQRSLRDTTHEITRSYMHVLEKFFGPLRLGEIHAGHLREYQLARQRNLLTVDGVEIAPWKKAACNSLINHELNVMVQILRYARLWAKLHPYYFPLRIRSWSPRRVPTEDEEARLFEAVRLNPEVALATWVATITNNTTASGCELRGLRLGNLTLREPTLDARGRDVTPSFVYIPREATKNDDRPRRIPLNPAARAAFMRCLQRAHRLGATAPEHYLFPFREKRGKYDPARPASRWFLRSNWNKLREAAGLPWLCPHDLRHLAITRMLEMGQNEETVQAIAGHVGRKMMEYYSHIRMDAKLDAVMAIDPAAMKRPARGVRPGQNHWAESRQATAP